VSTPPKDNEHIRADQQAFMEAYERAKAELGQLEGVVGVGFGHKQIAGRFAPNVAIVVFVRDKRPEDDVPPAQRIPTTYEGYLTDVRTPIPVVPGGCDNDAPYDTIQGGIQIEPDSGTDIGTLGCIVRRKGDGDRENVYLLSNKHVLYAGGSHDGNYVYHPYSPPPSGAPPRANNSLGPIQKDPFYDNVTAPVPDAQGQPVSDQFFIDCAIARIDIDSKCCGSTCTKDVIDYATSVVDLQVNGVNTLTDVRSVARDPSIVIPDATPPGPTGPFVYKVGRTTGRTRGIVRSVNATLHTIGDPSVPNSPPMTGSNVIEIDFDPTSTGTGVNCHGNPFFAEHGDSGSIVVDDAGRVVGLVQGVPDPSIPNSHSVAACHILPVLDRLGVCIPCTTGTSHGSCGATDGSGVVAQTTGQPAGDATIGFGAGVVAMPVSERDVDHMLGLLERFRATPLGPELHEVFARVRREVGYLVRNSRPVKVAWHRSQGPAYMAHVLHHLRGDTEDVPLEVDGVPREQMLTRMRDALLAAGSIPLREAINRYHDALMPILTSARTADECIDRLAEADT
jgi:hypothetical protein